MRMLRARTLQKNSRNSASDLKPARTLPKAGPAPRPQAEPPERGLPRASRPQTATVPSQLRPPTPPSPRREKPRHDNDLEAAAEPFLDSDVLPLEPAPEELEGWRATRRPSEYGPPAQLGEHLRIQAQRGHRAGIIELRPGLFLVAEIPAETLRRPEFGAAFLVPLVTSVAVEALKQPSTQQALQRVVQAGMQLVTPQVAGPTSWPLALPAASYSPAPPLLHASPPPPALPALPWAGKEDVAGTFGCEGYAPGHCPCRWRTP